MWTEEVGCDGRASLDSALLMKMDTLGTGGVNQSDLPWFWRQGGVSRA